MLKALWEKMIAKFHAGEANLDAETIAVLAKMAEKIEAIEKYLATTPNHIGQTLPLLDEAAPVEQVADNLSATVDAALTKTES